MVTNTLIPPPTREEEEKTTIQEKTDFGTDNDQKEGEENQGE